MVTLMNESEIGTLEQVRQFLDGTEAVQFRIEGKGACYAWIEGTLRRCRYRHLGRTHKGLILRYLARVSGYSRQQVTRLVKQYIKTGRFRRSQRTVSGFKRRFSAQDIRRLARLDELHGTLNTWPNCSTSCCWN